MSLVSVCDENATRSSPSVNQISSLFKNVQEVTALLNSLRVKLTANFIGILIEQLQKMIRSG